MNVKVLVHETKALVDSSAAASFCSSGFWWKISSIVSRPQMKQAKNNILVDFSGKRRTNVSREVILLICTGDAEVNCPSLVIAGLSRDLLLGRGLNDVDERQLGI